MCYNKIMLKRGLILGGVLAIISSISVCNVFADETASSTFSIDVSNAALQVTAPATASIELNPTSSSAVFGSTNITVNVATNNMTGYTITMTVPTTDLTHSTITGDNAPVIPTLQSAAPQSTFPANAWGYKVTGDNYNPVQLTNTNPSWATENPTNGTDHIITLAAKVDGTKHSGTYTNTLTFNVIANPTYARDDITFDKNNDNASGSMSNYSVAAGTTANLPPNTFVAPAGYRFSGWTTTSSGLKEDGVEYQSYGDKQPYTAANTDRIRHVTLYAQWTNLPACTNPADCEVDSEDIPSGGTVGTTFQRAYEIAYTAMKKGMYEEQHEGQGDYALVNSWPPNNEPYKGYDVRFALQDMTPEICASVTAMHDDYQALDTRDNKLYHITKLKDGNCWITQNLDLDLNSSRPLTSSDTDIGWNGTSYSSETWTPSASTVNSVNDYPDSSVWNATTPKSLNLGDWYYDGGFTYTPCKFTETECEHFSTTMFSNNKEHGHIGNYYNYPAAIATNDTSSITMSTTDRSLCPRGWRLPREQGTLISNDYYMLYHDAYGIARPGQSGMYWQEPLYFVAAGLPIYYGEGGGYQGWYWYGSIGNNGSKDISYTCGTTPGAFTIGSNIAISIRCLAR